MFKPLPLWQPDPILPAEPGREYERWSRVVVEFVATEKEAARGTYALILWDAARQRTVTLDNVTFPQLGAATAAAWLDQEVKLRLFRQAGG